MKRAAFRELWAGPGLPGSPAGGKDVSVAGGPRHNGRKTSGAGSTGNMAAAAAAAASANLNGIPLSPTQVLSMQQAANVGLMPNGYSMNPALLAQSHGMLPKPATAGPGGVLSSKMMLPTGPGVVADDQIAKKSRRLIKNRVAAKECRRKKKQYIRDVEGKIELLEQTNKSLLEEIDELKKKLAAATSVPSIAVN